MKKIIIIILAVVLLITIGISAFLYWHIKIPASNRSKTIDIEIIEGLSTKEIAEKMQSKGIIKSSYIFEGYTFLAKKTILPGIYYLDQNMNFDQILDILSNGKVAEEKITFIEGWGNEQIANHLFKNNFISDKEEFLKKSKQYEGYLFPDTYRIALNSDIDTIISKMVNNFNTQTQDLNVTKEQLILASIVEREAKNDDDRLKIARLYQNRLDLDMPLQADPTVQYAKGNWEAPTQEDYRSVESPYNTYLNKGLPPGPICNPGLKSIQATIESPDHDYIYFFHNSSGQTIYSVTYDEHLYKLSQE